MTYGVVLSSDLAFALTKDGWRIAQAVPAPYDAFGMVRKGRLLLSQGTTP